MRIRSPRALALVFILALMSACPAWAEEEGAEPTEYSRRGADQCLGCHGDDQVVTAIFWTRHAQRNDSRTPFGEGQLQCEACHGPGGAHTARPKRGEERVSIPYWGHASTASAAEHNGQCLACHESHVALNWAGSTHQVEDLNCGDCHNPHAKSDPVLKTNLQAQVCYECHVAQKADENKPYTHPVADQRMACTACHNPHGSTADYLLVRNSTNETCYACHQDKRGPLLWEHAPVAEDCSNCHRPHGSIHPAMLTQRPPLLCQACHSQAGHPSAPYTSAGLADGSANQNILSGSCLNCHSQVHGSNHPSGSKLMR
jgi:DmsE family decaheme c-type cytochrome